MRFLNWPAAVALLLVVAAPSHADKRPMNEPLLAQFLYTVADDFIVDVYYNGERVPDSRRKLLVERFGATAERMDIPVRTGDWIVFNVVNNRMRWGGAYYFAAAGIKRDETTTGFTTELNSGKWSCCDSPRNMARFISDRDFLASNAAQEVERPWHEGDQLMRQFVKEWSGVPIWETVGTPGLSSWHCERGLSRI